MDWIDVSMPLRNGIAGWPGDVPVEVARRMTLEQGCDYNISMITMSTHAGTHMDAPLHFIIGGKSIDEMPLDATVGPARIIEIEDTESIKPGELEQHDIKRGERLLFKTVNSRQQWPDMPFIEGYVYISPEAAAFLVERGVRCVAIDYLSVGPTVVDTACMTHKTLLGGGVWIIEGVYLADIPAGPCDLICLPLRVEGAEGAPARAIVRPL
jgi:arylformamidase